MIRIAVSFLTLCFSVAAAGQPRVLILGDSIYQNPAQQATKLLQGKTVIVRSDLSGEVFNTTTALANLDALLGTEKWDLIHFNYGLGDLVHRAPNMRSFRCMAVQSGGIRATSPADYEKNLTEITKRLKATGAKLVWASTTPITGDANGIYVIGSELEYNAIAAKVMAANGVPVNDMHATVSAMMKPTTNRSGHPTGFGGISIHPPFIAALCRELSIPFPPEAETQPARRR